jgi:hypothetical protein
VRFPADTWAWLRSGHVRAVRWAAAVVVVAVSWWWDGNAHSGSAVIYPLVLVGLMFVPDLREITTPFGSGKFRDSDAARPAVQRELSDASARTAQANTDLSQGAGVRLDDLAGGGP